MKGKNMRGPCISEIYNQRL